MKVNFDGVFLSKWLRNVICLFSIFCVVHYISESIHDYNYFSFVIILGCIIVGFIFSWFNINIQDR